MSFLEDFTKWFLPFWRGFAAFSHFQVYFHELFHFDVFYTGSDKISNAEIH